MGIRADIRAVAAEHATKAGDAASPDDALIGLTDPGKVAGHSWRHRMQDRLRATGCPADQREALLGHAKTVADGYGRGFPMTMLKAALEP